MSDEARSLAIEAGELIRDSGSLSNFIRDFGIGGILYAFFLSVIGTIEAAGDLILAPFRALAAGLAELVSGTVGETLNVVEGGATQAVDSFGSGATELLGPLAFPFSVAVAMAGVFVFVWFVSRLEFSPLVFLRSR